MKSLVFKGSGVEMQEKKKSNVFSRFVIQTCDIVDQGACMIEQARKTRLDQYGENGAAFRERNSFSRVGYTKKKKMDMIRNACFKMHLNKRGCL
jgi:hypothetical protein